MDWKLEFEEFAFAGCMHNCTGIKVDVIEEPLDKE